MRPSTPGRAQTVARPSAAFLPHQEKVQVCSHFTHAKHNDRQKKHRHNKIMNVSHSPLKEGNFSMSTFSGVTKRLLLCFLGGFTSGMVSLGVPCGDLRRFKVDALGGVSPAKFFPNGLRAGIGSGGISVVVLTTMLGGAAPAPLAFTFPAPFGPPYRLSVLAGMVEEDEPDALDDVWMLCSEVTAGDAVLDPEDEVDAVLSVLAFDEETPGVLFFEGTGGGTDPGWAGPTREETRW